jgi:hypothetical protein
MAQAMTVITLKQDFNPDKIPLIKLQQTYDDDTKEILKIPIIDGHSAEANIYGLNKFDEASEQLKFDTSDELFCFFCHVL